MKKENLQDFIQKFYLNGVLTKDLSSDWVPVPIQITNTIALVSIKSGDKSTLSVIDYNLDLPDGEFVIGNVKQFLSILSAMDQDITVELKQEGSVSYTNVLKLKDKDLDATIALADPLQIEERHSLKSEPQFEVSFKLTKTFIDKFVKAKKAIPDASIFAVIPSELTNEVDLIVNYDIQNNVNNIKITVQDVEVATEFDPLYFNCNNFAAILNENSDFREANLSFSEAGLLKIHVKGEEYEANYYMQSYK